MTRRHSLTGWLWSAGATFAAIVTMGTGLSADSLEAVLQLKTAQGFARYAAAVEARIDKELRENAPFLDLDRQPAASRTRSLAHRISRGSSRRLGGRLAG